MNKFHNQKPLQTLRSLTSTQPFTKYMNTQMSNKAVRLILLNRQTNLYYTVLPTRELQQRMWILAIQSAGVLTFARLDRLFNLSFSS